MNHRTKPTAADHPTYWAKRAAAALSVIDNPVIRAVFRLQFENSTLNAQERFGMHEIQTDRVACLDLEDLIDVLFRLTSFQRAPYRP